MIKIGDQIDTFFPGGVVFSIEPYTGRYPQWFDVVVRVSAPRTRRGWMEISVKDEHHVNQ